MPNTICPGCAAKRLGYEVTPRNWYAAAGEALRLREGDTIRAVMAVCDDCGVETDCYRKDAKVWKRRK